MYVCVLELYAFNKFMLLQDCHFLGQMLFVLLWVAEIFAFA
jgi:hypothetical protein